MKFLTKNWFEIQKEKNEFEQLDDKYVSWLEETAKVSLAETKEILRANAKNEDLDEFIEKEIYQIIIEGSTLVFAF